MQGDEELVTFAAANMISELAAAKLEQSDVINLREAIRSSGYVESEIYMAVAQGG